MKASRFFVLLVAAMSLGACVNMPTAAPAKHVFVPTGLDIGVVYDARILDYDFVSGMHPSGSLVVMQDPEAVLRKQDFVLASRYSDEPVIKTARSFAHYLAEMSGLEAHNNTGNHVEDLVILRGSFADEQLFVDAGENLYARVTKPTQAFADSTPFLCYYIFVAGTEDFVLQGAKEVCHEQIGYFR